MISVNALILNLIVYLIIIIPLIISFFFTHIFFNKKTVIRYLAILSIIEIILSILLYKFSYKIFSLFTSKTGTINFAVFASRILFLDSSLYAIKFLIPMYLKKSNKKTVIFVLSKITANILFAILGYLIMHTVGFLYSFPICDIIYYFIYIYIFIKS